MVGDDGRVRRLATLLAVALLVGACSATPAADPAGTSTPANSSTPANPTRRSAAAPSRPASTPAARSASTPPASATSTPPPPTPIPPISRRARRAGLVDVRTAVPDAVIDLRYATPHNFTHVRLYPTRARCLVHRSMVRGLKIAAARLRARGLVLVFWDCYRPHAVQVRMFEIVPNPNWVARPGPYATSHEAGRSVDVTLARAKAGGTCAHRARRHCLLPMGTGFDDFTPRAWAYATQGLSTRAVHDRAVLRRAMARGAITIYAGEWWHFDGPGSKVFRPHLHAPVY